VGTHGFHTNEALSYGWRKFGENAGPMLLAALLLFLVVIPGNYAARMLADVNLTFSLGGVLSTFVTAVLAVMICSVIARGALDVTEGYRFDLVLAFRMLNFVHVFVTALVVTLMITIGLALLIIPGVVVAVPLVFAVYAVADDDTTDAFGALRKSFRLVSENAGDTIILILLTLAVIVVALLALCIGGFVALPVLSIVWAYSYKVFDRKLVAA